MIDSILKVVKYVDQNVAKSMKVKFKLCDENSENDDSEM